MKFKIKPWMIYLLGIPIVYGISRLFFDHHSSLSLVGEYLLCGTIGIGIYYLGHRLWFGKRKTKTEN